MKRLFPSLFLIGILLLIDTAAQAQLVGRVFRDDCYQGQYQWMFPGSYRKSDLSVGNDKISSVYMYRNDYYMRLYEHDNYGGEYRDVYYHMNDLNTIDFEDEVSSIKVYSSNTTLPTSNEEVISAYALSGNSLNYVSGTTFTLPKSAVSWNSRIHMQGLGQNEAGNRIVLTGCVASGPTSGCTGKSYMFLFDNNGNFLDVRIPPRYNGVIGGESHPSSTQMIGNVFPVAVAEETGQSGPSVIKFFTIDNDDIQQVSGSQSITVYNHIGTLAYANINGYTYLIGGTWNSARLYIWRAYGENRTSGFSLLRGNFNPYISSRSSIDENWSAYNSFWLGKMAEDGRVTLFATHGPIGVRSWADIWEIRNIQSPYALSISKIHKRYKDRWTTNRPYFLEGTYPVHRPGTTPDILAFPDDFKSSSSWNLTSTLFRLRYGIKNCGGSHPSSLVGQPPLESTTTEMPGQPLDMTISPNPAYTSEVTLGVNGLSMDESVQRLQCYNSTGQLMIDNMISDDWLGETRNFNVADLPAGIYTFTLTTDQGQMLTQKLVKM